MRRIAVAAVILMPTALFAQEIPFSDRLPTTIIRWEMNYIRPIITMKIQNPTESLVKDFGVECDFFAKSGTKLSTKSTIIYDTIPLLSSKTFSKIEIGYVDPQSERISCVAYRIE